MRVDLPWSIWPTMTIFMFSRPRVCAIDLPFAARRSHVAERPQLLHRVRVFLVLRPPRTLGDVRRLYLADDGVDGLRVRLHGRAAAGAADRAVAPPPLAKYRSTTGIPSRRT